MPSTSDARFLQAMVLSGLFSVLGLIIGGIAGPYLATKPDPSLHCGLWIIGPMVGGALFGLVVGACLGSIVGWLIPPRRI